MNPSRFLAVVLVALTFSGASVHAQEGKVALSPGVMIDLETGTAFISQPTKPSDEESGQASGGIAAVNIESGHVTWENPSILLPLQVTETSKLLGAGRSDADTGGVLPLCVVDEGTGAIDRTINVPLKRDASISPMAIAQGVFNLSVRTEGDEAIVGFNYQAADYFRALPPFEGDQDAQNGGLQPAAVGVANLGSEKSSGAFKVNLSSGDVESIEGPDVAPIIRPRVTVQAGGPSEMPIADVDLPQFLSADGRHVIAKERTKGAEKRYAMQVFDRESQQKLGQFASDQAIVPFIVRANDDLIQVIIEWDASFEMEEGNVVPVPPRVQAIDLGSGNPIWAHAVADRQFRGQLPH